jgi:hypothetical protein
VNSASTWGNVPKNGMFGAGFARRIADVRDGLSHTLAVGEFVHLDRTATSDYSIPPGICRPWIYGNPGSANFALYIAKSLRIPRSMREPLLAQVLAKPPSTTCPSEASIPVERIFCSATAASRSCRTAF